MGARKQFTPEFKREAAQPLKSGSRPAAEIARNQPYKWQTELRTRDAGMFPKSWARKERTTEIARLTRELARVTEERDILKKRRQIQLVSATPHGLIQDLEECGMARLGRPGMTDAQQDEIWRRWRNGGSLSEIGRAVDKSPASIFGLLRPLVHQSIPLFLGIVCSRGVFRNLNNGTAARAGSEGALSASLNTLRRL